MPEFFSRGDYLHNTKGDMLQVSAIEKTLMTTTLHPVSALPASCAHIDSASLVWRPLLLLITLLTMLLGLQPLADAQTIVSPTVGQTFGAGTVQVVVRQTDGKVIIGGTFTHVNGQSRNRIARLNSDGSLDSTWNPNAGGTVTSITVDSGSGDVYAGGSFTTIGGQSRNRIAKLSGTTGAADATWNPNAGNTVSALALDGADLYASGSFTSIGGQSRNRIAKLATSGTGDADATWNPNAGNTVSTLAPDGSGSLYAGGQFTSIGGQSRNRIAKLSTSGTGAADATWNPNAGNAVNVLVLDGSGNLYAGGSFTSIGGQSRNRIAKLSTSGTGAADATWDPNSANTVNALTLSGTDLYAGGSFTTIGGQSRNRIAKLATSGTGAADAAWDPNSGSTVNSLAVDGSGNVYPGGSFNSIGGQSKGGVAKLNSSAAADTTWASAMSIGSLNSMARDASGRIIVGGVFAFVGDGTPRTNVARFNANGTLDTTWNPAANNSVNAIAIDAAGDIYLAGNFTTLGGLTRNRIGKVSDAGTTDATWDPNSNNAISSLRLDGSGNIYVGGDYTSIGGQNRNRIAKLSTSGTGAADTTWDPNANNSVTSLALDGTDLFAGGLYTTIGGQTRNRIAKLATSGTGAADATWNPNADATVRSVFWDGSGNLYVGGQFTNIGGQARNRIAKLATAGTGAADATWNPDSSSEVWAFALSGTDLYVGGQFITLGGLTRNRLAKVSTTGAGAVDTSFDPNLDERVKSIVMSGSTVHAAGWFGTVLGQSQANYVALSMNAPPTLMLDGGTLAYTENATATQVSSGASATDADGNWNGGTLTVQMTANATVADTIAIGTATGLSISGTDVNDGATTFGTASMSGGSVTNNTMLTITFNASANSARVQSLVRAITFVNGSDTPSTTNRTITFTLADAAAASVTGTRTVTVTDANDAPTIAAPASIAATPATALTGISFADVDSNGSSVTASFLVPSGTLSAASGGGVTVAGSGSASLTLSGTVSDINTFIVGSNLSYTGTSNGANTLTIGINDEGNTGSGGAKNSNTTVTLNVTIPTPATVPTAPVVVVPTPTIPELGVSVGGLGLPPVLNVGGGSGPTLITDIATQVSNVLAVQFSFSEQTSNGTVVLNGLNGSNIAFLPLSFLSSDNRPNGIYPVGNGQFSAVSNGLSLTMAPALVHIEQLLALQPGVVATVNDSGSISVTVNGVVYVVLPDFAVQRRAATGTAQLTTDADGTLRFTDSFGNSQLLGAAFLNPGTVRNILLTLDTGSSLMVQQNGTASVVFNGQRYTLVPDLTLGGIAPERLGQSWWQESPTRYHFTNPPLPSTTAQGFTVR
ncbi:MAG: hypothetical protein V4858_29165 [Pseudomonadota bacterium]